MLKVKEVTIESPREMDVWVHGFNQGWVACMKAVRDLDPLMPEPSRPVGCVPGTSSAAPPQESDQTTRSEKRSAACAGGEGVITVTWTCPVCGGKAPDCKCTHEIWSAW